MKLNVNNYTLSTATPEELRRAYIAIENAMCNRADVDCWGKVDENLDFSGYDEDRWEYFNGWYDDFTDAYGFHPAVDWSDEDDVPSIKKVMSILKEVKKSRIVRPFDEALQRIESDLEYSVKEYLEV